MTTLPSRTAPFPLTAAAALAALEGVALVVEGLTLLPALSGPRAVMVATSSLFFLLYGVGLVVCAWQLRRLHSWARAPLVLAQLIQVMVGLSFWGAPTTAVAVVLVLVAVLVLVGIFHPASLAALSDDD